MCDCCSDLLDLLVRYDRDLNEIVPADDDPDIYSLKSLSKSDLEVLGTYTQLWSQRRCPCILKEVRNIERLNNLVKGLLVTCYRHLKYIHKGLSGDRTGGDGTNNPLPKPTVVPVPSPTKKPVIKNSNNSPKKDSIDVYGSIDSREVSDDDEDDDDDCDEDEDDEDDDEEEEEEEDELNQSSSQDVNDRERHPFDQSIDQGSDDGDVYQVSRWSLEDREKLLHLVSKVFMTHFPVYAASNSLHSKHHQQQNRLEDLVPKEAAIISSICDLHDSEIPLLLLKNITFFCQLHVMDLFSSIFAKATPATLPLSLAHAIVVVINHLKYGFNLNTMLPKLVTIRSVVINYLVQVPDLDLRIPSMRSMFEFMWTVIKDPLEQTKHSILDREGLTLALKYFTSTTLTMRLTGISQITHYINVLNDCSVNSESHLTQKHIETLQDELIKWILHHQIIEHIFGPNLHVEVIKQSHLILNFVAPKINTTHIDSIWSAAQLKHCSKQVHDLLTQLVKNMNMKCVFHLYSLLRGLEPKDHHEQTLHLTACILRYIWARSLNIHDSSVPIKTSFCPPLPKLTDSPIFTMLPARSQDGESSSASADASDDDDDDFDVVVNDGKLQEDQIQPSPESNSSWSSDGNEQRHQQGNNVPPNINISGLVSKSDSEPESTAEEQPQPSTSQYEGRRKRELSVSGRSDNIKTKSPKVSQEEEEERGDANEVIAHGIDTHEVNAHEEAVETHEGVIVGGDEGEMEGITAACRSNSSQNSESSDKRLSDFDGEDCNISTNDLNVTVDSSNASSNSPGKMLQASLISPSKSSLLSPGIDRELHRISFSNSSEMGSSPIPSSSGQESFSLENVCKSGQTLLWDLLQDERSNQLSEGLSQDCEKILCSLINWISDRKIKMKFIEGCLENLEKNRSVIVSLRLIPKLLLSFQGFRGGADIHQVTRWADSERRMMDHFFEDLNLYCMSRLQESMNVSTQPSKSIPTISSPVLGVHEPNKTREAPSHVYQIQTRLNFLTFVFSATGSNESFRLSKDQVDILWSCLAEDRECRDDFFTWLINQIRSRDCHGINAELFGYIMTQKMPHLKAEHFTMMALDFLHLLCFYAPNDVSTAIRQSWDIALTAVNTDVSMAAIRHLNTYYIHSPSLQSGIENPNELSKEQEFIKECMSYLKNSAENLSSNHEKHSTIIQRALVLLSQHLEKFRQRYSFHLRRLQLSGEESVVSHKLKVDEKSSHQMIRIVCQPAALSEKTHFELHPSDYVGELRAEITHWWEQMVNKCKSDLVNMNLDGPLRLLSQGQELTHDLDEKHLSELGFKDMQLVYVSIGVHRQIRRPRAIPEPTSLQPPPPRNRIPSILLLDNNYLEQLFDLSQQLGSLCTPSHVREQVLSRRVWDIIQILPTNPRVMSQFKQLCTGNTSTVTLNDLLSTSSPQKLMYSIQIVEWLRKTSIGSNKESSWSQKFIESRGLRHLFDIFVSGILQQNDSETAWSEWKQDCLASLLHLIYSFGIESEDGQSTNEQISPVPRPELPSPVEYGRNSKKQRRRNNPERNIVHKFNSKVLGMLNDTDSLLKVLLRILDEATSRTNEASYYQTGFWGRAQIVHHTIVFLVSWVFSDPEVSPALFSSSNFAPLLKKLILDEPDPNVRNEVCIGFSRMCHGYTIDHVKGHSFIPPLLNSLLKFISLAQNMGTTVHRRSHDDVVSYLEKEHYGPGCKEYFSLVGILINSLESVDREAVDFDQLSNYISKAIVSRDIRELRHNLSEDEGLRGLITLMTACLKHNPQFKFSDASQKFLVDVFNCMFALPSHQIKEHPKCKVQSTRSAAFDLLVELCKSSEDNHLALVNLLQDQHKSTSHTPYPWDFWPHDDCRSDCGYVGLINLGATCYMASCLQHLFMIPETRHAILSAKPTKETRHESILTELQKLFAFLAESERKSYNPRSFCKVYTMDHEYLNTGEQKDMTEFFTDLISKLEEMTDDLKEMVKNLFGGTLSNNVVSLDCPHISRTTEEFYTLRCKVADMRNLWDSLDELTVKDTLEGDNMYTCSQCGKKVRAEKRACLKKLPRILCFNTMRYTFNMITMTKEKVNTHFSFPLTLDMAPYLEHNLIPEQPDNVPIEDGPIEDTNYEYELIGVTVHTGTAEGGHYYSFIREREAQKGRDKWYMFNDAEVKPFDPNQIGAECFGGEMTSKTYDSVTDKFMDFSFEKTNSAYMLFYEKLDRNVSPRSSGDKSDFKRILEQPVQSVSTVNSADLTPTPIKNDPVVELPESLSAWIWDDNIHFLRDKMIFEHSYFDFMWQVCNYIPQTINVQPVHLSVTKLATSFVLETLIHSKEKPTLSNWIELLTKQFNANSAAGEWLLEHMADDSHWAVQILLKSPNQMVRQLFQRLCIHVISQLRSKEKDKYLTPISEGKNGDIDVLKQVGQFSSITRFVKKILTLIKFNNQVKPHPKHLTEYFTFLYEFAKLGEEESKFLLVIEAITIVVSFYMNHCKGGSDYVDMMSDDEDDDDDEPVAFPVYRGSGLPHLNLDEKSCKPPSLEKMIHFVAYLIEKSRGGPENRLRLSSSDHDVLFNGKGIPFVQRQIRDNINLRQTLSIITSYCRNNETAANQVVNMMINAINRSPESSSPFFRLLSMLVDHASDSPGHPDFGALIYPRIWEIAEHTPQHSLEWLTVQVPRNKQAHSIVLQSLESWTEYFILSQSNQRVRNAAAILLISLVPNNSFRQSYNKSPRLALLQQNRESLDLTPEAIVIIQRIFQCLLNLLKVAKDQADSAIHGTSKLVSYFTVMTYCLVSKNEKLMLVPHFNDLWSLFQPKLSEPAVPVNHNKQALLHFWYQACIDCPENVRCIVSNPVVVKNIAFNYILADHDDQDVILFNRSMLPSYYGLLKLCCSQSRPFTRQLAQHQNIQWAFKNITPFMNHYQLAAGELFKLMKLFIATYPESTEAELREIEAFKKSTINIYLTQIDSRSSWSALNHALNILVESEEDRSFVIVNNGILCLMQAFSTLFMMFHEATACHVTNEIVEILKQITQLLVTIQHSTCPEVREWASKWKDFNDLIRKLVHLLNTYTPAQVRLATIGLLQQLIQTYPKECIPVLVQCLGLGHLAFQDQYINFSAGPYFPRRGQRTLMTKSSLRPPKAVFQMHFHPKMLETKFGNDEDYDKDVTDYYAPYYQFIVTICKTAINHGLVTQEVVGLCSMVAVESLPMNLTIFPKFWVELLENPSEGATTFVTQLCTNCNNFRDFLLLILSEERDLLSDDSVFQLFDQLSLKVNGLMSTNQTNANAREALATILSTIEPQGPPDLKLIVTVLRRVYLELKLDLNFREDETVKGILDKLKTYLSQIPIECQKTPDEESPNKRRKTDGMETEEEIVSTSLEVDEEAPIVPDVDQDGQNAVEVTVVTIKVIDDSKERIMELLERTINLSKPLQGNNDSEPTPSTSGS